MNLREAREVFLATREKLREARTTLTNAVQKRAEAYGKLQAEEAALGQALKQRGAYKRVVQEASEQAGSSLFAELSAKCDRELSEKADEAWGRFEQVRGQLAGAATQVRAIEVNVRAYRAQLEAAEREGNEAIELVKKCEQNVRIAEKIPGLLHAEVSGMCGAAPTKVENPGNDLGNEPGNELENATAPPQQTA